MLQLKLLSIDEKLRKQNVGYYNQSIDQSKLNEFKLNLNEFIKKINDLPKDKKLIEESLKGKIKDKLIGKFYSNNQIDIIDKMDLVILDTINATNTVEVIFELKAPQNSAEMISKSNPNAKALNQLVHYYMQERLAGNDELKHLIATNGFEWYIFDAVDFEKLFFKNDTFLKQYEKWDKKQTVDSTTLSVYDKIKNFLDNNEINLEATYFDLRDYQQYLNSSNEKDIENIIYLYKIFSPQHLLKLSFANYSSTLNKEFYNELLYILGLEEKTENGKIIISRANANNRQSASLIENTINHLKSNKDITDEGQLFEIALELCITWLNRILFLKLLEGQLIKFHNDDKVGFSFMNIDKIKDFYDLNELFFKVLAIPEKDRDNNIKEKYKNVPYLNSSLFEKTEYEIKYDGIFSLKSNLALLLYKNTVLKDANGKPRFRELYTLNYLFEFLNSYDFSSDSGAKVQRDNRPIINAAVLGLIFEKINGYKDGSYFTPGYITEYMCRESISRAVVQKFKENENQEFDTLDDVKNYCSLHHKVEDIKRFNGYINSLRICDPAVGSGHFLVSALNVLIAIKSELNILADDGVLIDYDVSVDNDELIVINKNNNKPYKYFLVDGKKPTTEVQNIQRVLFNEKVQLIENCLFGVDINSKSVQITRLRLWIELLKNAYYKAPDYKELETLPNIDINIKCGDSLISIFNLKDDTQNLTPADRQKIKNIIRQYKEKVIIYKSTTNKTVKHNMENEISILKEQFMDFTIPADPDYKKLKERQNAYVNLSQEPLHFDEEYIKRWQEELEKLSMEVKELEKSYNKKVKTIYGKAFEWRFEFPEVLDDYGNYIGFDVVIGNPPYIQLQKAFNAKMKYADLYKNMGYETFDRTGDIYCLFYERGVDLLKNDGILCYISSNKWMRAGYGKKLRAIFMKYNPLLLIDLGPGIFENATVDTCIFLLQKAESNSKYSLRAVTLQKDKDLPLSIEQQVKEKAVTLSNLSKDTWFIAGDAEQKLKEKIERIGKPLKDWDVKINRGITTGFNDAFIINSAKRQEILDNCKDEAERERTEKIIKPILRGRDIKRYYYEWAGLWVIVIPAGWTNQNRFNQLPDVFIENTFPSLINHLKNFEEKAKKRDDKGDYWWELRPCKYYEEFEKEKVVWQRITQQPSFCLVSKDMFILDSMAFFVSKKHQKYQMAILNSKIIFFYVNKIVHQYGVTGFRLSNQYVEIMPIPPITTSTEPIVHQIETLVDEILTIKKENPHSDTTALEHEIDELVYRLYDLTEDEIKIVEGNL